MKKNIIILFLVCRLAAAGPPFDFFPLDKRAQHKDPLVSTEEMEFTTVTIGDANNYTFEEDSTGGLALSPDDPNQEASFSLYTANGDGSEPVSFRVFGLGTKDSILDSHQLIGRWSPGNTQYEIFTLWADSAATTREQDLVLYTYNAAGSANTDQVKLSHTGVVSTSGPLTVGGTLTVTADNDIALSGTGHVTSGSEGFIVGTLTILDGSITDSDGAISFGSTNLSTSGTIQIGADNVKLSIGATVTDLELYSDGTDGQIDATGTLDIHPAGGTTLGDNGTTDYTNFADDGLQTMAGTARVFKHVVIGVESAMFGATVPTTAIIGNYIVDQFSQNPPVESIHMTWHIPSDWAVGTDILIHLHWAPVNGNAGDVVWDVDFTAVASNSDEVISGAGTALTVTDSTQSLQDELLETADMTMTGAGISQEDTLGLKISRDTGDGNDTYGSSASLVLIEIKYLTDKLGEPISGGG